MKTKKNKLMRKIAMAIFVVGLLTSCGGGNTVDSPVVDSTAVDSTAVVTEVTVDTTVVEAPVAQ
jgi:ABC-type glycerol-3-phosphate transport system substrate-binding protein